MELRPDPDCMKPYIFTDAQEYIPYFMLAGIRSQTIKAGLLSNKFVSFGSHDTNHMGFGYKAPAQKFINSDSSNGYYSSSAEYDF